MRGEEDGDDVGTVEHDIIHLLVGSVEAEYTRIESREPGVREHRLPWPRGVLGRQPPSSRRDLHFSEADMYFAG